MDVEGPGVNPYAPPGAAGELEAPGSGDAQAPLEGSDFAIRFAARVIDMVVHFVGSIVAGGIGGLLLFSLARSGSIAPDWLSRIQGVSVVGVTAGLLATTLLHTLSEGICGASPGKLACKLRVVMDDGSRCTLLAALIRSLAYFVDTLFCGLVGYGAMKGSPLRQRYGDRWAGTVVVRASQVPEDQLASGATTLAAWGAAFGVSIVIQIAGFIIKAL